MKEIPLRTKDGSVAHALVDDADYPEISRHKWFLHWKGYAVRGGTLDGRHTMFRMHRVILGLKHGDSRQGDHINYDKLDNRRENLRIVTLHENLAHRRFAGVCFDMMYGKWRARATVNGQRRYLGRFATRDEALAAVATARTEAVSS